MNLLAIEEILVQLKRGGSSLDLGYVAALACSIAGLLLGFVLIQRWRNSGLDRTKSAAALLHELCTAHKLGKQDRQLLLAAPISKDVDPCQVFVDPSILGHRIREKSADSERYVGLSQKLFG